MSIIAVIIVINLMWIYFIYWNHYRNQHHPREYITVTQPSDLDHLKSGDILLLLHNDAALTMRIFGDEFSHVAIVYEDTATGIKYVFEGTPNKSAADFFGNDGNGAVITPLWTRLSTYRGRVCVNRLNKPLDLQRRKLFDRIVTDYNTALTFDANQLNYIANCVLVLNTAWKSDAINCSMMIARCLQDIGVFHLHTKEICMRPQCFAKVYQHTRFADGYNYSPELLELKFQ